MCTSVYLCRHMIFLSIFGMLVNSLGLKNKEIYVPLRRRQVSKCCDSETTTVNIWVIYLYYWGNMYFLVSHNHNVYKIAWIYTFLSVCTQILHFLCNPIMNGQMKFQFCFVVSWNIFKLIQNKAHKYDIIML